MPFHHKILFNFILIKILISVTTVYNVINNGIYRHKMTSSVRSILLSLPAELCPETPLPRNGHFILEG